MRAVGVGDAQAEHAEGCVPLVSGGSRGQHCLLVLREAPNASRRFAGLSDAYQLVCIGCHWARQ
jgi:hypothetical protein